MHYALDEDGNEIEWEDGEEYQVEAIVGTRISAGPRADKTERYSKQRDKAVPCGVAWVCHRRGHVGACR